uniref:Uncharacterized protein n=1 Tax=Arundo donax TaxID=35708 RepID=A0A0A8YY57_ARUDO
MGARDISSRSAFEIPPSAPGYTPVSTLEALITSLPGGHDGSSGLRRRPGGTRKHEQLH